MSSNFMLSGHLLERDKKNNPLNQISIGLGGGIHRSFNFVEKSGFFNFEEPSSWEFSLSWELSFDIKNFRVSILQSNGKMNAWGDDGVIKKSNFYSLSGSYIFEL